LIALRAGSATDIGRVRNSNQDVALVDHELFAVADGMGGHVGGEVAARVAAETLQTAFARQPTVDGLRRAVAEANRAIWRQSQVDTSLRGMGTTLTAIALVHAPDGSPVIALANVGDSRAYVYSDGQMVQVTDDHSLAEEKVRQGELTEAEASVHPHRHILTRALGVASDVEVDLWELRLQAGDRILLCSDGLTNEVTDERIGAILTQAKDPTVAAGELVRIALDAGGNDNVTVVVVDVVADLVPADPSPALAAPAVADPVPAPEPAARQSVEGEALTQAVVVIPSIPAVSTAAGADAPTTANPALGTSAVPTAYPLGVESPPTAAVRLVPGPALPTGGTAAAGGPRRVGGSGPSGSSPSEGSRLVSVSSGTARAPGDDDRRAPTRRERRRNRRRAGIPRLITFRVIIFLVLLAGVVYAGFALVRWYANDDWYVTVENSHLVVFHGRPGGFLWYKPKLMFKSTVTTAEIPTYKLATVKSKVEKPTLTEAKQYITNLHKEYLATQQLSTGVTPNPVTTTTAPVTTTTKPGTTTTRSTSKSTTTTTAKP
jgi:PPM family protein phosphatase